jgi:hypothetical protein
MKALNSISFLVCLLALVGCHQLEETQGDLDEKQASAIADFYDFSWSGQMFRQSCSYAEGAIDDQVLYTVGQLNGDNSVGRLDQLKIDNIETESTETGCFITYDAVLPVAWGAGGAVPESYEFVLPRDMSKASIEDFVDAYTDRCLDWGAHDVTAGVFWYYYRPNNGRCKLEPEDVVRLPVSVAPSADATEGQYPEYHKVWEDGVFNVVAIFGKAKEDGSESDVGVRGYGEFIRQVREELRDNELLLTPSDMPDRPGTDVPFVRIKTTLADGKQVIVNAFLVEKVTNAPASFWAEYESLTETADYIVYNGHSGLGQNVRALARRGNWIEGQYAILFLNGCDTYAYIDASVLDAHADVNDDDDTGTRYLDVVANAMPSYFRSMPQATMAIFRGLLSYDLPMTYEEILKDIDSSEVALVTGEHDNEFTPDTYIP